MSNRVDGQAGGGTGQPTSETRRDFVKKAAYVAPLILTVAATPTLARTGSRYNQYSENKDYSGSQTHYWSQIQQYISNWFD